MSPEFKPNVIYAPNYEPEYIQQIKMYFTDNSTARIVNGVRHFGMEGGMLRIITEDGTQYYPEGRIFNLRVLERTRNPRAN